MTTLISDVIHEKQHAISILATHKPKARFPLGEFVDAKRKQESGNVIG